MPSNIFFVRHGAPQLNTGLEYRAMPGPGLSQQGREEARQAAAFLAGRGITQLFASPFARAVQTAEAVAEHLNLPITFSEQVMEHSTHENLAAVQERVHAFLSYIAALPDAQIAVVTHGSPIKQMLIALTDGTIDLRDHIYDPQGNPVPTAGIWHAQHLEGAWQAAMIFRPTELI